VKKCYEPGYTSHAQASACIKKEGVSSHVVTHHTPGKEKDGKRNWLVLNPLICNFLYVKDMDFALL